MSFHVKQTIFFIAVSIAVSAAVPKKYDSKGDLQPNGWKSGAPDQMAVPSHHHGHQESVNHNSTEVDRTQRFGFSTAYGNTGVQGYPNTGSGVGVYTPLKLDLGGVVVGALIGLGALVILPKLVHAFSGGYGYGRSEDSDASSITTLLAKLDDTLVQYNIDSSSCVQRFVCSYVRSAEEKISNGAPDQMDQIVHTLSSNSLVEYMIDGTAIKEAVAAGRKAGSASTCETLYPGCPLNKQTTMQLLTKLVPAM